MESQSSPLSGHIVMLCMPSWGHLRPLASLACKTVKERTDVSITFLCVASYYKQLEREIGRYFSASAADSEAKANIRLVSLGGQGLEDLVAIPFIYQTFPGYYDKLINSQPIQCLEKNKSVDAISKPTAVIFDFFFVRLLRYVRSVTHRSIPVYAWTSSSAACVLRSAGPTELGGFGDIGSQSSIQAKETGRNEDDIIKELYRPSIGNVIAVAGLPQMYDYEWFPQENTFSIPGPEHKIFTPHRILTAPYNFARECDGFLSVSSTTYEQKSLEAFRGWIAETNRPVYAIGPLIPPGFGENELSDVAKQMEMESSANGDELQAFLDKALQTHGKHSVMIISFGSVWWPKKNEYIWILVDALLEKNFPFILSHAPPKAVVPAGYTEKIKQSGIGLLSKWTPQQMILNHSATGWFLTHCGQNSVTESLASGIPIIAWPLDADQPGNAAHLTLTLDVAFQMVEIRTGEQGLKPLYRGVMPAGTDEAVAAEARTIIRRVRGEEGERKRRNAEAIRDRWRMEWEEGGGALMELRRLLTDCSSGK